MTVAEIYCLLMSFYKERCRMVGNTFGRIFRVTTCGESYAGAFRKNLQIQKSCLGTNSNRGRCSAGIKLTADFVQEELDKRDREKLLWIHQEKKGQSIYFSGVMEDDITTGAPVG